MEHLTHETFKSKIYDYEAKKEWSFDGELPCIVDFYAEWCGPCKQLSPVMEALAEDYKGRVNIYKVDIDKEPKLANDLGISSVPSILFVPKTGAPQLATGAAPRAALEKAIDQVLLNPCGCGHDHGHDECGCGGGDEGGCGCGGSCE